MLAGESPVPVIAKEPGSKSRCVAVMRGAKRDRCKNVDRNIK